MIGKWLSRSIRRRHRVMVAVAMVPLVVLNALPVSAGCRCADGHIEPVCQAARCLAGKGDCGCPCCVQRGAVGSGCSCCMKRAERCSQELADHSPTDCKQGVRGGNGCCTPLVHQAVPTVLTSPQIADGHQMPFLAPAVIDLPASLPAIKLAHRIEFDTGPPPQDFVVTFHRLVI